MATRRCYQEKKQLSSLSDTTWTSLHSDILQSCNTDQLLPDSTTYNSSLITHTSLSCHLCNMDNCINMCMIDKLCDDHYHQSIKMYTSKFLMKQLDQLLLTYGFIHLGCVILEMTWEPHIWSYTNILVWMYFFVIATPRNYMDLRTQFESSRFL